MKYHIAGFTHEGTYRNTNQDRILIQNSIYSDGIHTFPPAESCVCFVADGIGGGPCGDIAAEFVLNQISQAIRTSQYANEEELNKIFLSINSELIELGKSIPGCSGMATTLVGIILDDDQFKIVNAGDSQAYVYRSNRMIKLTQDHLLDPLDFSSPVTSYFGGQGDELHLDFDTVLREVIAGDIFLLSSDGLFKSLTVKQVKAILSNSKLLVEKAKFMLQKAIDAGADDNVSTVLIEVIE